MINLLLFVLFLATGNAGHRVHGIQRTLKEDLDGQNSIYNPKVHTTDQISASRLWVENADNKIEFGWHVAPKLYGNDGTYTYASWTVVHQDFHLGSLVNPTSIYGGVIMEFSIAISQDPVTKNWWLNIDNEGFGYFPATLFSNLGSANKVGWGGYSITPPGTTSPQTGSGYFPDDDFEHSCYFRYMSFQDSARQDFGPKTDMVDKTNDKSNCYGVDFYGDQKGEVGISMQFGGPGGN
ncbi:hypothetical protein VNO78_25800 [Psophocarpus tetragonolobus]|uniref:Neprosin PEP catalytic domain-containing protein n=1 Tax=Psophocarpus tetragonolobus TaxID=3891 RepID=A0AAN9XFA9_PSOTE